MLRIVSASSLSLISLPLPILLQSSSLFLLFLTLFPCLQIEEEKNKDPKKHKRLLNEISTITGVPIKR